MTPNDAPLLIAEIAALVTALGALWRIMGDPDEPLPARNGSANGNANGGAGGGALLAQRVEYLEITTNRQYSMLVEHGKKLDMLIEFQMRRN